jgi:hypothetical protein
MPSTRQRDTITPEVFLARYSPEVQAIANALRQLVKATIPDVQERVALGWQLLGYRVPDGIRSRYFCFVAPQVDEVRLGFEYGVLLGDQSQLEGDGNQVRYVPVRSLDTIDPQRLSSLIAEGAMVAIERGAR